jgi:hypothetical protein
VPIDVTWTGPRSLRVTVPDVLAWEVHLAATAATRLLSSASRLLPDRSWDAVTNSTALVGGHDIGPPGPLPTSMRR